MPTFKIIVEAEDNVGSAYQSATPEKQQRVQERAQRSILRALMAPAAIGEKFDQIRAQSVPYAEKQGWTEEMNEALLRGEYDGDL